MNRALAVPSFLAFLRASVVSAPVAVGASAAPPPPAADDGMSLEQVASLRTVQSVDLSPDGSLVAYTLSVPRIPGVDEDGAAWSELHVVPFAGGPSRAYVPGPMNVADARFTPDGRWITYSARRSGDEEPALWAIPVAGGESRRVLAFAAGIGSHRLSPDGRRVAFLAAEPERDARRDARKEGFDAIVFEEDWRRRRIWIAPLPSLDPPPPVAWDGETKDAAQEGVKAEEPRALEVEGSVADFRWSPDGERLVLAITPRPLADDDLMLRRLRIVDAASGAVLARIENPGKLGGFEMSPDGRLVALVSAADFHDPSEGRLLVAPATGGELRDLLPDLLGHVRALAWQDARTVMFLADIGTGTIFGEVDVLTGEHKTHFSGGTAGDPPDSPVLAGLALSTAGHRAAFAGSSARHPAEVFAMAHGDRAPRRLTDGNPWLAAVAFGRQEVIRHPARDGLELEGILIHPRAGTASGPAPLILVVHGGPESNMQNDWLTGYSRPGQVAAGRGYAVFHPNYRGSTGRGVAFAKLSQGDPAGKEFDDLIDAVDHLVATGIADPDRVGVTGGSYGGYATAWLSTFYSERIAAGVMAVGISNELSKAFTTDIPLEDRAVHTLFDPGTKWQFNLERSPVYHAEKCRTPLLILGGTDDTRVNPEQSMQLYRALAMFGNVPVRYVQYPGEGHGNRRATSRYDYSRRMMLWFDHYLRGPGGDPPAWDLRLGEEPGR
ncbi:MAG: S9 family peptidase [Planctomycetota bacterium]